LKIIKQDVKKLVEKDKFNENTLQIDYAKQTL